MVCLVLRRRDKSALCLIPGSEGALDGMATESDIKQTSAALRFRQRNYTDTLIPMGYWQALPTSDAVLSLIMFSDWMLVTIQSDPFDEDGYFERWRGQILKGIPYVGAFSKRRRLLVTQKKKAGLFSRPGLRGKD